MSEERRVKWDQRHASAEGIGNTAAVMTRNRHLLPGSGEVLDLACGRGVNALWLAEQGLDVHAWDYSKTAIGRLQEHAEHERLIVQTQVRDVVRQPPEPEAFDAIVVSFFLERELAPALIRALRPGGRLFYQTFTRDGATSEGPGNPAYRLGPNELLQLFDRLLVRYYREDGAADDGTGARGVAMLVGERGSE